MSKHGSKHGGIIPIAAFLAAVPGLIAAAAPYLAAAAGAVCITHGVVQVIKEVKEFFSKKGSGHRGKGLYDPVYDPDMYSGSGCSCHKKDGHGIYDPVYPDRGRCSSSYRSSRGNDAMRFGGYGLRDPVYGRGVIDILNKMGKKGAEKMAEVLRDQVMDLPSTVRNEVVDHFINAGKPRRE